MTTRVSDKFDLGTTQAGLDFVDVDVVGDVRIYIEPRAIRTQHGDWADSCIGLLQTFFESLLEAVQAGDRPRMAQLLGPTEEPNETHLGESRANARGRGLGAGKKAEGIIESMLNSHAVESGLLVDLEDSALLVPKIGRDTVSDMTTAIIRGPLILYTQQMCLLHQIPTEPLYGGEVWNADTRNWEPALGVQMPIGGDGKRLLLVPKSIVRFSPMFDKSHYYIRYLRPHYEQRELDNPASQLVDVLKGGKRVVRLGKLDDLLGTTKPAIAEMTKEFPEELDSYRGTVTASTAPAPVSKEYEDRLGAEPVDYFELHDSIRAIAPGKPGASAYHRAVANLLGAIFDGALGNQKIEVKQHGGLKRVDITYDNLANSGFFAWLAKHYHSAIVPIECKNYTEDVGNPELDQLAMRLSPDRGRVGILVCRNIANKDLMLQRRKAVTNDQHGYVLALDDDDLYSLAQHADSTRLLNPLDGYEYPLLRDQFNQLINQG